ncbi:hypothetical protein HLH26_19150 [Gluconacetobacter sp. 1b LMG 1731]|uniref:Uncharacterized protein n=1 Tax=Gluconacetobacter dulcium TaxID=2729096 RepID=A0A7W4NUH1_9PROT|nr:hypothetical protein [Gluconacetobacter dulcium]MBB2166602.1 hypothetical protein [Gluconacetobacter dulcium]MBB2195708.1 hypothetical protein [Gluconacetobacter dulcium]
MVLPAGALAVARPAYAIAIPAREEEGHILPYTAEALQGAEAGDLFIRTVTAQPGVRAAVRMTKDRYRLDLLRRGLSPPAYAAGSGH